MRIVRDDNPGAHAVKVQCLVCGKMLKLADAEIDLDGPAFQAYYHLVCLAPKLVFEIQHFLARGHTGDEVDVWCKRLWLHEQNGGTIPWEGNGLARSYYACRKVHHDRGEE